MSDMASNMPLCEVGECLLPNPCSRMRCWLSQTLSLPVKKKKMMQMAKPVAEKILELVAQQPEREFEELLSACPELTWNQVFWQWTS